MIYEQQSRRDDGDARGIDRLNRELNILRQEKKQTSAQAEESIQLIMESSSSQIFSLQEALDRSHASVESLTRFVRELLRRPAGTGFSNEDHEYGYES